MSEKRNDGGSAFPTVAPRFIPDPFRDGGAGHVTMTSDSVGMSLRDYFAGQVIAAVFKDSIPSTDASYMAFRAYDIADAMLKFREQK